MTDRLTRDLLVAEISGVEDSDYARLLWRKAREEIENLRTALVRYGDKSRMASVEPIGLQQTIDRAFLIDALNARPEPSVQEAVRDLIEAATDLGLREIVAGWNGEGLERPYKPHPPHLSAQIKTTCGVVYRIDAALRAIAEKDTPNDR